MKNMSKEINGELQKPEFLRGVKKETL